MSETAAAPVQNAPAAPTPKIPSTPKRELTRQ